MTMSKKSSRDTLPLIFNLALGGKNLKSALSPTAIKNNGSMMYVK